MDNSALQIIVVVLVSVLSVVVTEVIRRRISVNHEAIGLTDRERGLVNEIVLLRSQVEKQERKTIEYERKLEESSREIGELRNQVEALTLLYNKSIRESQARPMSRADVDWDSYTNVPLLLVCGSDRTICALDKNALRRAAVPFRRLDNPTLAEFGHEMTRRRLDGTMYKWLLLSSHMGPEGMELNGSVVTPEKISELVSGVDLVVFAGCSSVEIADYIIGIVPNVISIYEAVESSVAADFNYAFWRRMLQTDDVGQSYDVALREIPAIREYIDIRRS